MKATRAPLTVALCSCVLAGACRRGDAPATPGPMASALLAFAAESGGASPAEGARAWPALEAIARRVAARRNGGGAWSDQGDPIVAMNAVVFDELGFTREIERHDAATMTLPSVLAGRRGSCVGLGALYLVVAERLGIPLEGVLVPGHFFVRAPEPRRRNVELLRRGEAMPDRWYIDKYGPWDARATSYLRGLTVSEVVAVHWFNAGNQLKGAGELGAASRAYTRAAKNFPDFAEAEASLGAARQLQGDLSGAQEAYQAAASVRPDLPGLAHNRSILNKQQRFSSSETGKHPAAPVPFDQQYEPDSGHRPRRSWP